MDGRSIASAIATQLANWLYLAFIGGVLGGCLMMIFWVPQWTPESIKKCHEKPEWCAEEMPRLFDAINNRE